MSTACCGLIVQEPSMTKNSSSSRAPKTGAQLRDDPEEREKYPHLPLQLREQPISLPSTSLQHHGQPIFLQHTSFQHGEPIILNRIARSTNPLTALGVTAGELLLPSPTSIARSTNHLASRKTSRREVQERPGNLSTSTVPASR